jgi:hypothetical protein
MVGVSGCQDRGAPLLNTLQCDDFDVAFIRPQNVTPERVAIELLRRRNVSNACCDAGPPTC